MERAVGSAAGASVVRRGGGGTTELFRLKAVREGLWITGARLKP
jgi:hypothetical protein